MKRDLNEMLLKHLSRTMVYSAITFVGALILTWVLSDRADGFLAFFCLFAAAIMLGIRYLALECFGKKTGDGAEAQKTVDADSHPKSTGNEDWHEVQEWEEGN